MGSRTFVLAVVITGALYLILRLGFPETIEFGYDQPRLATKIISYIDNGRIFETQKFAEVSPWGNISWGPSLFYFYAPFFIFSKNPILISNLVSVFNLLSIFLVMITARRFFSDTAGIVAGIFLATQPWWLIFSRMIYQPSPVVTLISLSMFLFLIVLKKPQTIWLSVLIFSWVFMIQVYFHTFSFVVSGLVLLVIFLKGKIFNKFLLFGILASSFLLTPYLSDFDSKNYVPARPASKEDEYKIGRDGPLARIKTILPGFFLATSGDNLVYQLGYSYKDFLAEKKVFPEFGIFVVVFSATVLVYHLVKIAKDQKSRKERTSILIWTISPILFLIFIPLPNVPPIPRYFLVSLAPFSILYGIFFAEIVGKVLRKYVPIKIFATAVCLAIPVYWLNLGCNYFSFIKNYSYPQGHLSTYSDTPYYFLNDAVNFAINDSWRKRGEDPVISNDESSPKNYSLDWATNYLWTHVFNKDKNIEPDDGPGFYLIDYSYSKKDARFTKIYRSGPYSVYEFRDL